MKILIRNSDNVVIYAQDDLVLTAANVSGSRWRDDNFNTSNATIAEATLPADWTGAVWAYSSGVWSIHDQVRYDASIAALKSAFIKQVDADADALIKSVMGERATEYLLAEQEAAAFKTAGYTGTVPGSVSSEATAKGVTATVACDTILATAAGWRAAQAALRAQRLLAKASASSATTAPALDTIKAQWAAFLVVLKGQLGVA